MRTILLILLLFSLSYSVEIPVEFIVPEEEVTLEPFRATVTAKVLYIRERPCDTAPIIGSLSWGDVVHIESGSGFCTKPEGESTYHQWFRISARYGEGWVWGGYLKIDIRSVNESTLANTLYRYLPDAEFQLERDLSFVRYDGRVGFFGPLLLDDIEGDRKDELVVPIYDGVRPYLLLLQYPSLDVKSVPVDFSIYVRIFEYFCSLR